ncbi:NEOXANTHIN-DEFICIENT 1-like isoform X1 [Chlorella sorokiniana]|uniref:NEOXANTHIN-DEFICIENT 1-like isoform X1 n=1 Tax=Chlorella sorokiniana TaxID=3076 RepID=A0A2P6U4M2_CHLSO|nr:NEOXANTHIN-DEFICIENT 1-like isoform X1 [Chlorella sorokiniana]|eukprot:PRW61256.1 NEOXANTHIN-DEFICIENT 1-like isoform X1 [Chlorella sorokiniana]
MGYGEAPWEFRGRALYQLSLVRVEEARKYVPPELPLVSFFGWTLGGFYLARYSDSPVGAFDECVALAGLAWNFPTSCAWAARVYVNDREARDHGISSVGLPSRMASFKALPLPAVQRVGGAAEDSSSSGSGGRAGPGSWWDLPHARSRRGGGGPAASAPGAGSPTAAVELYNSEPTEGGSGGLWGLLSGGRRRRTLGRGLSAPVCRIEMPQLVPAWAPRIQMFLPSFSGATPDHPGLLKYSLKLTAFVRPLPPARVTFPGPRMREEHNSPEVLDAVLGGRPLICLAFDDMEMLVQPPLAWHPNAAAAPATIVA